MTLANTAPADPCRSAETHPAPRCARHILATYEHSHPDRERIEHFIQRAFAQKHGARIRSFMPTLFALHGRDDRICGVAGIRSAGAGPLFLEQYLTQPIETALFEHTGERIARERIVEVGNLSSISCRAAFHLVALIPRLLIDRGHLWVAFTATSTVRGILRRFDAPVIDLSGAAQDKVANLGDDWGRYYDHDPRVMAAWLPNGLAFDAPLTNHA